MIRKSQTDYTILVLGFILAIAILAASCTTTNSFKGQNCAGNKALLHSQGSPQKAFKF